MVVSYASNSTVSPYVTHVSHAHECRCLSCNYVFHQSVSVHTQYLLNATVYQINACAHTLTHSSTTSRIRMHTADHVLPLAHAKGTTLIVTPYIQHKNMCSLHKRGKDMQKITYPHLFCSVPTHSCRHMCFLSRFTH